MADKIERIIADTFLQMAEGLETGNFGKKPKIALTGMGSEHGEENAMEAAKMAAKDGIEVYYTAAVLPWITNDTPSKRFVIRPRNRLPFPMIMAFLILPLKISSRANPI